MRLPSSVVFVAKELADEYHRLEHGTFEERVLHERITKAFYSISLDAFGGTQLRKALIPPVYAKHNINNLWKYDLPDGWRLIYSIKKDEIVVISLVIEWMSHKDYERRFNY